MKRSRLNPVSKKRQAGLDMSRFPDSTGLYFDEVRGYMEKHFGLHTADWPAVRIIDDSDVLHDMHCRDESVCWECKESFRFVVGGIEAHHISGGTKGRSDEYCNIAMLCTNCHLNYHCGSLQPGRILYLKWIWDRQHTNWVRLTLLKKRYLPDLITDSGHP